MVIKVHAPKSKGKNYMAVVDRRPSHWCPCPSPSASSCLSSHTTPLPIKWNPFTNSTFHLHSQFLSYHQHSHKSSASNCSRPKNFESPRHRKITCVIRMEMKPQMHPISHSSSTLSLGIDMEGSFKSIHNVASPSSNTRNRNILLALEMWAWRLRK